MVKAVLPGSFDPPTEGHLNLIKRAATIFDHLYLVIAVNNEKACLFTPQERFDMMKQLIEPYNNIELILWDKLIVQFAEQYGAKVIVRGVRALADFSYEFELAMTNKQLNPNIEAMFLPTDPKYFVLRSSAIKEIALYHGDVSAMVPDVVAEALKKRFSKKSTEK